jgi:hypothetical protein
MTSAFMASHPSPSYSLTNIVAMKLQRHAKWPRGGIWGGNPTEESSSLNPPLTFDSPLHSEPHPPNFTRSVMAESDAFAWLIFSAACSVVLCLETWYEFFSPHLQNPVQISLLSLWDLQGLSQTGCRQALVVHRSKVHSRILKHHPQQTYKLTILPTMCKDS